MTEPMSYRIKNIIDRYVEHGVPVGDFLTAFLSKDLTAIARADEGNRRSLLSIWSYCYNEIPAGCWGSPGAVKSWIEQKRKLREFAGSFVEAARVADANFGPEKIE